MIPLRITATLSGAICLPEGPIALDSLLMAAVALRDGLDPPASPAECRELEIPIAMERGIYLASSGVYSVDQREGSYTNQRFPLSEAQDMASPKFRRIQITAGKTKSYRLPREHLHLRDDRVTWFAIGDADAVRSLLVWLPYLGRKRAVGLGKVRAWDVAPCAPWEGFPVLRDGYPLRTLPLDWPGLRGDVEQAYAVPTPPYWDHARRALCAVPGS